MESQAPLVCLDPQPNKESTRFWLAQSHFRNLLSQRKEAGYAAFFASFLQVICKPAYCLPFRGIAPRRPLGSAASRECLSPSTPGSRPRGRQSAHRTRPERPPAYPSTGTPELEVGRSARAGIGPDVKKLQNLRVKMERLGGHSERDGPY